MAYQDQRHRGSSERHKANNRIRAFEVKVVDENGTMLGVMQTFKAQSLAREKGLDLVEVNSSSNPPICKIMDLGKMKYEEKKSHVHHKPQQTKEILIRPKTADHDMDFKTRHIVDFLKEGHKVKLTVKFRGREIVHQDEGRKRLLEVINNTDIKPISQIEYGPTMEGRNMILILAPPRARSSQPKPGWTPPVNAGPVTGRFSANGPNLSNYPKADPSDRRYPPSSSEPSTISGRNPVGPRIQTPPPQVISAPGDKVTGK